MPRVSLSIISITGGHITNTLCDHDSQFFKVVVVEKAVIFGAVVFSVQLNFTCCENIVCMFII